MTMAIPASKRRKLVHQSSDDDDDASFASFGESGDEQAEDTCQHEMNGDGDGDEDVRHVTPTDKSSSKHRKEHPKRSVDPTPAAFSAVTSTSPVFQWQVDELLRQIRPRRGKREEAAEQALHALKKTIEHAAPLAALPVGDAQRHMLKTSRVAVPFPDPRPPKDAQYKLEFAEPAAINVVGSHAVKMASRATGVVEVDMMVQMPSSLFQAKDYLNYRYFYKRAYYLACLAAAVKQAHPSAYDLQYEDLHGDALKPALVVAPAPANTDPGDATPPPKWRIVIIPCVASDVFAIERLLPEKNCVRPSGDHVAQPTPCYNAALRADMLVSQYLKLLHGPSTSCEAFRDAGLLGSTWLRQRGFGSSMSAGGFGNFEWSALMAFLLQGGGPNGKPILSTGCSSYQLFKATLQVVATKDMSKHPWVIGTGQVSPTGDGSPVVWDDVRAHNLLYKVAPWTYQHLRQEARTTLNILGDQLSDGFEASLISRVDNTLLRYDHTVEIPISLVRNGSAGSAGARDDYRRLYGALKQGLMERVSLIRILPPQHRAWQAGSARPSMTTGVKLQVGLIVNSDKVDQAVVHGPPAEEKTAAAAFREFWGEKAELRRFKDGSIMESLIWSAQDEQSVLEQVVRFIIKRHVSEQAEAALTFSGNAFAKIIKGSRSPLAFQSLMEAYKQMEFDIRGLPDLPLSIRHILPSDPQLRYASIRDPSGAAGKQRAAPADVIIQFEGSTRWPDDLAAIQRTKIAFLLDLSRRLEESSDSITAKVGLENQDADILNQAHLDIIYHSSGAVFRVRIHHDREHTLFERQLKDKSLAPSIKEIAAIGLAAYKRNYLRSPSHTQALARLCSRHPSLSGTIRLLKTWFASHLLSNHFPEPVIELLAARTFVHPYPWQTPSSIQTGFLRTLHWLSRWDWRVEPLIVDLSGSGEFKIPEVRAVRTRFEAWRKLDSGMNRVVLFAASNVDSEGTTWTDFGRPARVVAGRMTALARAACAQLEENTLDPRVLFQSPLSDYDFVVHLDPRITGIGAKTRSRGSFPANGTNQPFQNLELAALNDESMVGYDPASSFLADLEELYGSSIVFFSGGKERAVIAGLFSPQVTTRRDWKVNLAFSTVPVKRGKGEGGVMAEINRESVLAEIARVGGDLVASVERNR